MTFFQADPNDPGISYRQNLSAGNDKMIIEIPVIKEVSFYQIFYNDE